MSKITTKFLFQVLIFISLSVSVFAQMQIPSDIQEDLESRLAAAENTIITDAMGRVIQISIVPASGTTAEVLNLGYDSSGLSSITDSRGTTITIQRNEAGAVKSFIFPGGGSADINPKGCVAIDTFNISYQNKTIESLLYADGFESYRPIGSGSICRDAAWATALALAVCTVSPASTACWTATATAAYLTYKCYEETHPN